MNGWKRKITRGSESWRAFTFPLWRYVLLWLLGVCGTIRQKIRRELYVSGPQRNLEDRDNHFNRWIFKGLALEKTLRGQEKAVNKCKPGMDRDNTERFTMLLEISNYKQRGSFISCTSEKEIWKVIGRSSIKGADNNSRADNRQKMAEEAPDGKESYGPSRETGFTTYRYKWWRRYKQWNIYAGKKVVKRSLFPNNLLKIWKMKNFDKKCLSNMFNQGYSNNDAIRQYFYNGVAGERS